MLFLAALCCLILTSCNDSSARSRSTAYDARDILMSIMTEGLAAKWRNQQPDYGAIVSTAVERQNSTEFGRFAKGKQLFVVIIPDALNASGDEAVMIVADSNGGTQFHYRCHGESVEVRTSGFYEVGKQRTNTQEIILSSDDGGPEWTTASNKDYLEFVTAVRTKEQSGEVKTYD
jgi:hypothetical protein